MRLSDLSLIVFLIVFGVTGYGWVHAAYWVAPLFALIAGVLYLLEGLGVSHTFGPDRRPRP